MPNSRLVGSMPQIDEMVSSMGADSAVKPSRRVSFSDTMAGGAGQGTGTGTGAGSQQQQPQPIILSSQGGQQSSQRRLGWVPNMDHYSSGISSLNSNNSHSFLGRRPYERRRRFRAILKSRAWNFTLIVCTILLCFGAQIRDLFSFPEYADLIFNVIFCINFMILSSDIYMRTDSEPNYFDFFGLWTRKAPTGDSSSGSHDGMPNVNPQLQHHNQQIAPSRGMQNHQRPHHRSVRGVANTSSHQQSTDSIPSDDRVSTSSGNRTCNWGSFLFWCDLVSTLSLLYDISWTNPFYFRETHYDLVVNTFGYPPDGLGVNNGFPISINDESVFIAIAKSLRMARFIRSHTVVHLTTNINWHLMFTICLQPKAISKFFRTCFQQGLVRAMREAYLVQKRPNREQPGGDDHKSRSLSRISKGGSAGSLLDPVKKETFNLVGGSDHVSVSHQGHSDIIDDGHKRKSRNESQVGSAMRELTSQRIAVFIIFALLIAALFTYTEFDSTRSATMVVLHNQTANASSTFVEKALYAARSTSTPGMFSFQLANGTILYFMGTSPEQPTPPDLRPREIVRVSVTDTYNLTTIGHFRYRQQRKQEALVSLLYTLFIIVVWVLGVTAFAGPVMVLVVVPIERMVKLLSMLMIDPLGYQRTSRYKQFALEEDDVSEHTKWSRETLKGMETSFLMSTILRIGSLMQVGFGSAGVEIIRQNLSKSKSKSMDLLTNAEGSIVPCIFLFCDIRNFTDATESLQEEVFVFTNSIAAVIHSHCASLGGSANKNIGDAFLCSWLLDKDDDDSLFADDYDDASDDNDDASKASSKRSETLKARSNQADKCLLTVVRICMALRHDEYYLDALSVSARDALISKLQNRPGSVVQLGFGLHAGNAVQGAIGSQRKIDATYLSEAVERSEFLESSTKKYGVKMLMSDNFHRLLDQRNQRRCRKVDQLLIRDHNDDEDEDEVSGRMMDLLTYDMDIDALGKEPLSGDTESEVNSDTDYRRTAMMQAAKTKRSRISMLLPIHREHSGGGGGGFGGTNVEEISEHPTMEGTPFNPIMAPSQQSTTFNTPGDYLEDTNDPETSRMLRIVMPPVGADNIYSPSVWSTEEMRIIRQRYSDGIFFQKFNAGLQSFYGKDWVDAKQCFTTILSRFEDGPSRYYLNQIEQYGGKPPPDFLGYGIA